MVHINHYAAEEIQQKDSIQFTVGVLLREFFICQILNLLTANNFFITILVFDVLVFFDNLSSVIFYVFELDLLPSRGLGLKFNLGGFDGLLLLVVTIISINFFYVDELCV